MEKYIIRKGEKIVSMVDSGMYPSSVPPWVDLGTKVEEAQTGKKSWGQIKEKMENIE